jgi:hypothetical protein
MNADYDQGDRRNPLAGNCFHLADGACLHITAHFPFQDLLHVRQIDRSGNWIDAKLGLKIVVSALDHDLKTQQGIHVEAAMHNIAQPNVMAGSYARAGDASIDQFAQRMLEESMITLGEAIDFKAPQS